MTQGLIVSSTLNDEDAARVVEAGRRLGAEVIRRRVADHAQFLAALDEFPDASFVLADFLPNATAESGAGLSFAFSAVADDVPLAPDVRAAAHRRVAGLRWIQLGAAGVNQEAGSFVWRDEPAIAITTASGLPSVAMAQYVIGAILDHAHGFSRLGTYRAARDWSVRREFRGRVLVGKTLGLLGMAGSVPGRRELRMSLGMRVIAVRRSAEARRAPRSRYRIPPIERLDSGDEPAEIWGVDRLDELLAQSDYFACSVPLTAATRGLIGARELALLPQDAFVINVSRGAIFDQDALIEALRSGRLSGAALDVFDPEPLPARQPAVGPAERRRDAALVGNARPRQRLHGRPVHRQHGTLPRGTAAAESRRPGAWLLRVPQPLEISQLRGQAGAAAARGLTVLIDVLRAFTTAAYAFGGGAQDIVLVGTVEEAFALRRHFPDALLIGEVGGRHIPGFDLNNSPTLMARSDVAGRRLIQRTGAGTQAVIAATGADERVLGSLVVAGATARYVRSRAPRNVSLVATNADAGPLNEDDACARYLAALLCDEPGGHRRRHRGRARFGPRATPGRAARGRLPRDRRRPGDGDRSLLRSPWRSRRSTWRPRHGQLGGAARGRVGGSACQTSRSRTSSTWPLPTSWSSRAARLRAGRAQHRRFIEFDALGERQRRRLPARARRGPRLLPAAHAPGAGGGAQAGGRHPRGGDPVRGRPGVREREANAIHAATGRTRDRRAAEARRRPACPVCANTASAEADVMGSILRLATHPGWRDALGAAPFCLDHLLVLMAQQRPSAAWREIEGMQLERIRRLHELVQSFAANSSFDRRHLMTEEERRATDGVGRLLGGGE